MCAPLKPSATGYFLNSCSSILENANGSASRSFGDEMNGVWGMAYFVQDHNTIAKALLFVLRHY